MDKKLFLIGSLLGVGVLILGGCGPTAPTVKVEPTITPTPKTETAKAALKDLLAGGKDQQCTWTTVENGSNVSGTMYISGKKFRQDRNITDPKTQAVTQSYNLSDGESVYTWGGTLGTRGIKVSLTTIESVVTGTPSQTPSQVNDVLNQQYQYQCQPWTPDNSQFTPPTEVIFSDMSNLLKNIQQKFGGDVNIPSIPSGY
jgi:hypothetical protein